MAQVSISEAARLAGVSRQTIHRYIHEGKISKQNGKIDTTEIRRVFGDVQPTKTIVLEAAKTASGSVSNYEREALHGQIELLKQQINSLEADKNYLQATLKEQLDNQRLLEHRLTAGFWERIIRALKTKVI